MALLGWVPGTEAGLPDKSQPRFIHNTSGRFECRWATVHVQQDSPAIMLKVCQAPLLLLPVPASLSVIASISRHSCMTLCSHKAKQELQWGASY